MKKILWFIAAMLCVLICFSAVRNLNENSDGGFAGVIAGETETAVELTDIGSPYKFYFNRLGDDEKRAYNAILAEIYSMPESIDIPRIDADQLDVVFSALLCDNPDLFFVGRRCTLITGAFRTSCSIEYIIEKSEYEVCRAELEKVCEAVVSSLTNPDDEWQTELEIHDYIVDNCEYHIDENDLTCSSAYGALVNKAAACEGYSKAAKLLLDAAGVESAVLSGISTGVDGSTGAHMWNAVKIYGDYYYLDCTWDDPVSDSGKPVKIYSYFNINNEMISATHSDFSYDFNCTATSANYHVKTGKHFESYGSGDEKRLADLFSQELESGGDAVEIRFGSEEAYNAAIKSLIDGNRIYDVLSEAQKGTSVEISMKSLSYYKDPALLTLTVIPERN